MPVDPKYFDEIFETHLPYEIDMLRWAYERLEVEIEDPALCNAVIECFCLHARNLIEFFEKTGDVSAKAFANPSYAAFPGKGRAVTSARRKLNNQISHLIHDERTDEIAEKIGADLRLDYLNLIEAELAHLAQNLLPSRKQSWSSPAQVVRITAGPPSATNETRQSTYQTPTATTDVRTVTISPATPWTKEPD